MQERREEKRRGLCRLVVLALLPVALISCSRESSRRDSLKENDGRQDVITIAHAFGGIDGVSYTNSLEAFRENYAKGHRTFEVDFSVTSDGRLVCLHDWGKGEQNGVTTGGAASEEQFLAAKFAGKYTTMSLAGLFDLMKEYPDIWIVTDTKDAGEEQVRRDFEILLETAKEMNAEDVLARFVVQFYNEKMFRVIEEIYHFDNYIFTLYQLWNGKTRSFKEYVQFCKENGVPVITMWAHLANKRILKIAKDNGIEIYVHTVNDLPQAKKLQAIGVKGFYTDYLAPSDFD